jgi:glycosyltransferase involved in cell wall biosynthesis
VTKGQVAFVPSRFGPEVIGGAETVFRELSHALADRGWDVEVLTTAARDHFSWENEYPLGTSDVDGLTVRRFPAVVSTAREERQRYEQAIHNGWPLTLADQERWVNDDVRVPELFHYLLDHASEYRALLFTPYLQWISFACSQIAPERSVLWSCVHDEPYLRLPIFQPMFAGVAGLWFQSEPEHDLAHRTFPRLAPHDVVGCGIQVPGRYDPLGFREKFGIEGPFALYAGRREGAKNWERLLVGFAGAIARQELPFQLVTIGAGEVIPPREIADRVVDLGFLSDDDRNNAFAAADAYLQPSAYEAFSRTIMEAWLAGTIVIASGASEVVRWHCDRSAAGLVYDDDLELEQALAFVAHAPDEAAQLAKHGREYVLEHYTLPAVVDRIESTLEKWTGAAR